MKLFSFLRRRPRPLPVVMLLAEPRECVQGLKHLGNVRLAEQCQALRADNAQRSSLVDVHHRTPEQLILRPLAK